MKLGLLVLVASVIAVLVGISAPMAPAQTAGPSLQETLDYVNSKMADTKYEKNGHISVSPDHDSILSDADLIDPIQRSQSHNHMQARVAALDAVTARWTVDGFDGSYSGNGGSYSVQIQCKEGVNCVDRTFAFSDGRASSRPQSLIYGAPYPPDQEIGKRLVKAYTHLVELLQTEYRAKHDKDDPFAK